MARFSQYLKLLVVFVLILSILVQNGFAQAGVSKGLSYMPLMMFSSPIRISAGGEAHTCVLVQGGVKCWGRNDYGQLGDGTTTKQLTPVDVIGLSARVSAVDTGGNHTCGLTVGGGAICWGGNYSGQLGDGTTTNRSTPVAVVGLSSGVIALSAGMYHTCALITGGEVKCWGDNFNGQLGDGSNTGHSAPVDVVGLSSGVTAIAAGGEHTCALTTGGGVKCWGDNDAGQLGDGSTTGFLPNPLPVDVVGLSSGVAAITAGYWHTCALTTKGVVKCWGNNQYGELGNGNTIFSPIPVEVVNLYDGAVTITEGEYHTCAVTTTNTINCWGSNYNGQLGDGTTTDHWTPEAVAGLSFGETFVSAGDHHNCALSTTNEVKCWGDNYYGELGDGTTTDRWIPVLVVGIP